jgi:hypothetical protein
MNFCLASATVGGALSAATTITDSLRSARLALGTGTARVWTEQGDLNILDTWGIDACIATDTLIMMKI